MTARPTIESPPSELAIVQPSAEDGRSRVHPTVRLDFLVRVSMYPLFFGLYIEHLWPRGIAPWTWALFTAHLLVYPALARYIASRSMDSKRAELRNLLIDSFVIGCYAPICGFSIWPNVTGLIGIHAGNVSVGGARFAVRGLLSFIAGAAITGLLTHASVDLRGASLLTEVLSICMIVVYITVFSLHSHMQSQRNVQNVRHIRTQNARIAEQSQLVVDRTRQAEHARDAAEAANAAKSNFLANMSHELRTPLNAIIGYSEMVIEEAADANAGAIVPDLEKIRSSGKHLLGLINDVLDLSKIEAGRMELLLETFDLSDLLATVTSTLRPLLAKNGNTLEVELGEDLGSLHSDLTRVRQVLLNLLSNASKFTDHGRILLRASRKMGEEGEEIVFVVSDSGIGMTPSQIGRLFRPFTQADASTTRKYGGTGLGLTITKHFVTMMGGTIDVTSEAGRGTAFTVHFPIAGTPLVHTAEMPVSGSARRSSGAAAVKHGGMVLVIDDDADARALISRGIEREGFFVVSAGSGQEGLRLAKELRPDAITLDVLMSGMDGWAVLRALKADAEMAHIPVVMLSDAGDQSRAATLGAVASLAKPLDRAELAMLLKGALDPAAPVNSTAGSD
ncbi:MAG: ATP-binding protein [bacterium]